MPIVNSLSFRRSIGLALLVLVVIALAAFASRSTGYSSPSAPSAVAISSGGGNVCALTSPGGVVCWGRNDEGQLGVGTTVGPETCSHPYLVACSAEPVPVPGLSAGVKDISVAGRDACAVTADSGVVCWGDNIDGQLGDGTQTHEGDQLQGSSIPVPVTGLTSGVAEVATDGSHACALTTGGAVFCWGDDSFGELGDGSASGPHTCDDGFGTHFPCSLTPVAVMGLSSGVTDISVGGSANGYETCAIASGGLKCWGDNSAGELGDGFGEGFNQGPDSCPIPTNPGFSAPCSRTPVDVIGLSSDVTAVSVDGQHGCAVTIGGDLKCWGLDELGDLGVGDNVKGCLSGVSCNPAPMDVTGLSSGVSAVTTGVAYTCAVLVSGGAKCWGEQGELGDGSLGGPDICYEPGAEGQIPCSKTPVDVTGVSGGMEISGTCVVTNGGEIECWGDNDVGQLGDDLDAGPENCGNATELFPCSNSPVSVIGFGGFALGDANCDGAVNMLDTLAVLEYDGGVLAANDCISHGDVNCDGNVAPADALSIVKYSGALIANLPCAPAKT
jgi:alpha-tubulin suppressor-like RCC1 family protein